MNTNNLTNIEPKTNKYLNELLIEPLLNPLNNRLTVHPIKYQNIWDLYKKQQAAIWTAEEIDFSNDYHHFQKLNSDEQKFIKMILAFFAASDIIVNMNLGERFSKEVQIREAIIAYNYQMMMENIHCVSADTLILTDKGYYEISKLENKSVNIWNGKEFTEVVIKFTGIMELYKVTLSNGMELDCTSEHIWFSNKKKVYTKDLKINSNIDDYELPVLDNFFKDVNLDIPINESLNIKINWLKFYFEKQYNYSYEKIKNVQLLLTTIGIQSVINQVNDNYVLYFDNQNSIKLNNYNLKNNNIIPTYNIYVKSIEKLEDLHKTYCFNEPKLHAGTFNGIVTGQSETYSLQIDNIIRDPEEKEKLLNAIEEYPCIKKKANWAIKWITDDSSFAQRLIAFAIVEGVFFSGSFCSIFWLKKKNMMPGLCDSNELIARDEAQHVEMALLLNSMIINKVEEKIVHDMFKDAVDIEKEFICDSLPCSLLGMNSELMIEYIKFVADRLLKSLNYNIIWNAKNPFDFMESISMEGKTNFFESRPTQYQKASVLNTGRDDCFEECEDF